MTSLRDGRGNDVGQETSKVSKPLGRPLSNISRKRVASPQASLKCSFEKNIQSQRPFEVDLSFASSSFGSIASRLPLAEDSFPENAALQGSEARKDIQSPMKRWRYSSAPQLFAEIDTDVNEPFPAASPLLPPQVTCGTHEKDEIVAEPLSSGYSSPMVWQEENSVRLNLKGSNFLQNTNPYHCGSPESVEPVVEYLEQPSTNLLLNHDQDQTDLRSNILPAESDLRTPSKAIKANTRTPCNRADCGTCLWTPTRNNVEFAKQKREALTEPLDQHKVMHRDEDSMSSISVIGGVETNCFTSFEPSLHAAIMSVPCSDPSALMEFSTPAVSIGPNPPFPENHRSSSTLGASIGPCAPIHHRSIFIRSPMPLSKPDMHTPKSYFRLGLPEQHNVSPMPFWSQGGLREHVSRAEFKQGTSMTEHFQPGWYYAKDSGAVEDRGPPKCSFSTATSKVVGRSPAPDCHIKVSYRTDTQTALAKPKSRFRKISSMTLPKTEVSSISIGGLLGDEPGAITLPLRHKKCRISQESVSSSNSPVDLAGKHRVRKQRKKNIVSPETAFEITEDNDVELEGIQQISKWRATVAGSKSQDSLDAPESRGHEIFNELGPNVTPWRKGMTESRKKRRPSYWDSDLEEVRNSPAARHVRSPAERQIKTSPLKSDIFTVWEAKIDFETYPFMGENRNMAW